MKHKIGFALFATAAMLLGACDNKPAAGSSTPAASKSRTSRSSEDSQDDTIYELPKFDVVIKGADGTQISKEQIEVRQPITKPADPTAPAGMVFYGWKNNKNGGQIWDFEADHELNQVMADVELEPMFVPAGMTAQTFEAELCREITEANGGRGMDGATYSGGAKGKQFVIKKKDIGATCVNSFKYYATYETAEDKNKGLVYENHDLWEEIDSDLIKEEKEVTDLNTGALVHFNYKEGNVISWELESDAAATGVTMFARFSAEYGKPVAYPAYEDTVDAFTDEMFQVKVNGVAQTYGNVAINNIEGTSGSKFIYCQDYLMNANLNLKAGKNKIEMVVNNSVTLNGTIAASAPCIDSIKLFSTSNITWPNAKYTNLL